MSQDKKLTPYTLKLSQEERVKIKVLCATNSKFHYQYDLFDAAVNWAVLNKEEIVAIANPKKGTYGSYYLNESINNLKILEEHLNCNTTRALHSALIHYLKDIELEENSMAVLAV